MRVRFSPLVTTVAWLLFAAWIVAVTVSGQGDPSADAPAAWFAAPETMPTDVFDLPFFDQFRSNGRLNLARAAAALETLSDADLPAAQRLFDIMAWKAFIALNWAARADGTADPSKGFGDLATPRPWESWVRPADVFLADGRAPAPWGSGHDKAVDHFKAAWRMHTTVNEGKQAFSGPLIDQNGRWVHYVSYMNKIEYDYLVANELYNLEGQAAFTRNNQIQFPVNDDARPGAIEIKFAWKVLTDAEARSQRFFTRQFPVLEYRPAAVAPDVVAPAHLSGRTAENGTAPSPRVETLGLLGMHIAMRTRSSPQWIWATFEHIDNTQLQLNSGDGAHPLPPKPSLSDPDNPDALIGANLLPAYNGVDAKGNALNDWDESKPMAPVEVVRLVAPPTGTARVNALAEAFLASKGFVFRYYELIGTQWPKHPKSPAVPGGQGSAPESIRRKMPGEVVPVYLINATMETYFQKGFQPAGPLEEDDRVPVQIDSTMVFGTESCVGCHYSAGACIGFRTDAQGRLLLDPNGRKIPIFGKNSGDGLTGSANFSWLLQLEAKSKQPVAR